jgi:thymidylate synthase (methanogen type)
VDEMMEVKKKTAGEAWIETCRVITEEGIPIKDGSENLKEVTDMFIVIENPQESDAIIQKYGDKAAVEWMLSNFFEQKIVPELKNSSSYGIRLFNYDGKDQIRWVVDKLKEKPETKAATITTLMPNTDKGYIPCVSMLDFKIRSERLVMNVFCRSIDFGAKAYANMIALAKVQDMVAKQVGVEKGQMTMHVVSAHIYERDQGKIKSVLDNFPR